MTVSTQEEELTSAPDHSFPSYVSSSKKEFVCGIIGIFLLLVFTILLSICLVPIQVIREENSEVIITTYPDEYTNYQKVVEPCAIEGITIPHNNTFQCNATYLYDYWENRGVNYYGICELPETYCPYGYECTVDTYNLTKTHGEFNETEWVWCPAYFCNKTGASWQGDDYDFDWDPWQDDMNSCPIYCAPFGTDEDDYYFDSDAFLLPLGVSSAPVVLFIFSSASILVFLLILLFLQFKNRFSERARRFNIILGLGLVLGGAIMLAFGGIAFIVCQFDFNYDEYYLEYIISCIDDYELKHDFYLLLQFSKVYIAFYCLFGAFYILMVLVIIGFLIHYRKHPVKIESNATSESVGGTDE